MTSGTLLYLEIYKIYKGFNTCIHFAHLIDINSLTQSLGINKIVQGIANCDRICIYLLK